MGCLQSSDNKKPEICPLPPKIRASYAHEDQPCSEPAPPSYDECIVLRVDIHPRHLMQGNIIRFTRMPGNTAPPMVLGLRRAFLCIVCGHNPPEHNEFIYVTSEQSICQTCAAVVTNNELAPFPTEGLHLSVRARSLLPPGEPRIYDLRELMNTRDPTGTLYNEALIDLHTAAYVYANSIQDLKYQIHYPPIRPAIRLGD